MSGLWEDPENPARWLINSQGFTPDGERTEHLIVLHNVHTVMRCAPEPCVLHNPTDHHMRDWPVSWHGDARVMGRVCSHHVWHPDPDDNFRERYRAHGGLLHICDSCCLPPR